MASGTLLQRRFVAQGLCRSTVSGFQIAATTVYSYDHLVFINVQMCMNNDEIVSYLNFFVASVRLSDFLAITKFAMTECFNVT